MPHNGRRFGAPKRLPGPRGQALVEFALVLPVLLLLMLVAVDFGRLFTTYIAVNNAAREATNYAAAHAADSPFDLTMFNAAAVAAGGAEANVQAQGGEGVLTISQPRCFTPGSGVTLDCNTASDFATGIGNQVTVSAQQPFSFLTPLVGDLFGGQLDLYAEATGSVLNPAAVAILPGPTLPPTPLPTASPTPSPTPSPDPGATPAPTPTPSLPPTCRVPDFKGTFFNNPDALNTWRNVAGFTGVLTDASNNNEIKKQTIKKQSVVPCSSSMIVRDK